MKIKEKDFIKFLRINQRLATKSIETYTQRFRIIKKWLEDTNQKLTPQVVVNFLFEKKEEENLTNSTINTYRQALVHIDLCYKFNNLDYGFTEGTKNLPKIKPEIIILSKKELEELLATPLTYSNRNGVDCSKLDDRYLTLTHFLAITGCRFEEAASLLIKRIDIENGKALLVETKNKENRYIFFEGDIKEKLLRLVKDRNPDEYVFTASTGNKILSTTFNENIKKRAKAAGINKRVYPHLLRHTFATHLLEAKVDITIVSILLGHKDIRTTFETYIHLADDALQQASRKHPLMKEYITPSSILKEIREFADNLISENDTRFSYEFNQGGINISIKPQEMQLANA